MRLRFAPPRGTDSRQPPPRFDDEDEDDAASRSRAAFGLEATGANGSVMVGLRTHLFKLGLRCFIRWNIPSHAKCWKSANANDPFATGSSLTGFCPVWSQKLIADCHSYKFSSLSYVRAALSYSTKASVRTDSNGVLSLQFMIADASGREGGYAGFVEFTVSHRELSARNTTDGAYRRSCH